MPHLRIHEPVGESDAFLDFQGKLAKVAKVDRPVLLLGERGTGKELAAFRLHYLSKRWEGPFITLSCAALAPSLIESELFGHEKGAFTGAQERRRGRFEAAHGGTLFLDEIGTIPMQAQEKILRVVEYATFERVGGTEQVQVDVRIVAATNIDLKALAHAGRFKQDLLDRLTFEVLFVPPLRKRKGDIPLLANYFAARMAHELGRPGVPVFSENAMDRLVEYPWPGNVRELKNVVERAVYRADTEMIEEIEFDPLDYPYGTLPGTLPEFDTSEMEGPSAHSKHHKAESSVNRHQGLSLQEAIRDLEIRYLKQALESSRYNQRKAASILGLTYHQFRGLYRKYRKALGT